MDSILCKIIGVSTYHGLSRTNRPYDLFTLEVNYNGAKCKIKTFDSGARLGDYAQICVGVKKTVFGRELVSMVSKIIPAAEIEDNFA